MPSEIHNEKWRDWWDVKTNKTQNTKPKHRLLLLTYISMHIIHWRNKEEISRTLNTGDEQKSKEQFSATL